MSKFSEGYSEGWASYHEHMLDRQRTIAAENNPSGTFMCGLVFSIFGGLFVAAGITQWIRFDNFMLWPFVIGAPFLALGVGAFRSVPKLRIKAREAREAYNKKWIPTK